jgi:hypothetical protein
LASIYRHRNAWQAMRHRRRHQQETKLPRAQGSRNLGSATARRTTECSRTTARRSGQGDCFPHALEYAHLYTIHKRGAKQEINLINRYLAAAGPPTLRLQVTEQGGIELTDAPPPVDLPSGFAGLRDRRAACPPT